MTFHLPSKSGPQFGSWGRRGGPQTAGEARSNIKGALQSFGMVAGSPSPGKDSPDAVLQQLHTERAAAVAAAAAASAALISGAAAAVRSGSRRLCHQTLHRLARPSLSGRRTPACCHSMHSASLACSEIYITHKAGVVSGTTLLTRGGRMICLR